LKKEARNRGLSSKGNKSDLISRIQEHEQLNSSSAPDIQKSNLSSVSAPSETSVAGTNGEVPGIPLVSPAPTPFYLNVALPNAAYDEPEPPVSIPYTLDFWDSSTPESTPEDVVPKMALVTPKMVVIAGKETYGDDTNSSDEVSSTVPRGQGGILDDLAEDMGVPHLRDMKKSIFKFFS